MSGKNFNFPICFEADIIFLTSSSSESFNIFATSGILFNHESPMRGEEFVTRKITRHFARMLAGETDAALELGNLSAKRDWGFAGDYVQMMWLMLQQATPDTYVIATGETHSIREFVEEAGKVCGFDIEWNGKDENETGVDRKTGKTIVRVNPKFYRPAEVELLIGDPSKAEKQLGWERKTDYKGLCRMMMEADIARTNIPVGAR